MEKEQRLMVSTAKHFTWAGDYSKVKFSSDEYYQTFLDIDVAIRTLVPKILDLQVKTDVCVDAFDSDYMQDGEFIKLMVPSLIQLRKVTNQVKELKSKELTDEEQLVFNDLLFKVSELVKTFKHYEIEDAEKVFKTK